MGYAAFTEYFEAYAPFKISSGYRCPIGNGNLPGDPSPLSRHVRGYAVDVTGKTVDGDSWPPGEEVPEKEDIREWTKDIYDFEFRVYDTKTHVHLGWPHGGATGPPIVQHSDREVTMTKAVLFSTSLALLAPSAAGAQEHEHKGNWPPVRQTFSSDEMVARIATLDPAQAMPALNSMWKEGTSFTEMSERVTPEVVAALIEALDYLLDQYISSYGDLDDSEGVFAHEGLFETVLFTVKDMFLVAPELRDPRAIPVLLKASPAGLSAGVRGTILDFGPRAVLPHTLACVFNPETTEDHLATCLYVLSVIVGVWGESIDDKTLVRLRDLTAAHLKQPSYRLLLPLSRLAVAIGWDEELEALMREQIQEVSREWKREILQNELGSKESAFIEKYRERYAGVLF